MSGFGRLRSIEFSRYRAFENTQRLELRPLTLLFGLNSAGKSAALRLLPILAAAARPRPTGHRATILDYSSPALRDARFQDLTNNRHPGSGLPIKFRWTDSDYGFELRNLGPDGEVVWKFDARALGASFDGHLMDTGNKLDFEVQSEGLASRWRLAGLLPVDSQEHDHSPAVDLLRIQLQRFSTSVHWLGAVRAAVPRIFELRPGADGQIGWDGSGVAEALRLSSEAADGAADAVSAWLKKTCDCELSFASSDGAIAFGRQFYPFDVFTPSGRYIAVRDVGEGVAQALPVVTLCHQARLGQLGEAPILAFEQPELHLHPAATVHLADEIVSCIANGSKASHVIETHAESMLLSLQIAIVKGRLQPDDVVVYWVASDSDGTSLRSITFDKEGFPAGGWPQGVFREALDQARRLAKLRISTDQA